MTNLYFVDRKRRDRTDTRRFIVSPLDRFGLSEVMGYLAWVYCYRQIIPLLKVLFTGMQVSSAMYGAAK